MQRYPRLMRAVAAQLPELTQASEVRLRSSASGLEVELHSDDGRAERIVFCEFFEQVFNDSLGYAVSRDLMALDDMLRVPEPDPAEA